MFDICETPTDFSLTNFLTDNSVSLSDFNGRAILLSFVCIRSGEVTIHRPTVGLLGYNHFNSGSPSVSDTYWWNISANLKYEFTTSPLRPYANGGPGIYIPESGSTEPGFNLGLGLVYSLYEDEGVTNAYKAGVFRKTSIISEHANDELTVTIFAAQGTYEGAGDDRNMQLEIITGQRPEIVFLGTEELVERQEKESILAGEQWWFYEESTCLLSVVLGNATVNQKKAVKVEELGNWDTSKAVKLTPVTDPWQGVWNGLIELPPDTLIEWKRIIKEPLQWGPGENNRVTTPIAGTTYPTYTSGSF